MPAAVAKVTPKDHGSPFTHVWQQAYSSTHRPTGPPQVSGGQVSCPLSTDYPTDCFLAGIFYFLQHLLLECLQHRILGHELPLPLWWGPLPPSHLPLTCRLCTPTLYLPLFFGVWVIAEIFSYSGLQGFWSIPFQEVVLSTSATSPFHSPTWLFNDHSAYKVSFKDPTFQLLTCYLLGKSLYPADLSNSLTLLGP